MTDAAVLHQKRESTDDRRIAIALAARSLIVEKGFEGLRTRDIADRVGINVATLHYHVPTKEALIELVAESMRDEFRAQSARQPRDGLSVLQCLHLEFADYRETLAETPELLDVFAELLMRAARDENVRNVIAPLHRYWVGQFERLLERGRDDGTFRPDLDPAPMALMITGAFKSTCRLPDKLSAFDRLAPEIERALINPAFLRKD
jgi:AcrR family transcriptional regulator